MSEVSAMRSAGPAMQASGSRAQEEARADRNQAQERRAEEAEARRQEERQRAARAVPSFLPTLWQFYAILI